MRFNNQQEPDNANETLFLNFSVAAARGAIGSGPRRFDDHRQELLAK
jgi:hypothetical protein